MTGFMRELSSASSRNHLFTCCRPHCVQFRPSSSRTTRPGVQHTTKAPGEREKQATGTQTSGSLFRFLLAQPSISGIKTLRVFFLTTTKQTSTFHLSVLRYGLFTRKQLKNRWLLVTFYFTLSAYSGLVLGAYIYLLPNKHWTPHLCWFSEPH